MTNITALEAVAVLLILGVLVALPLAAIWALNTLFGLGIPYNALTWLAAAFLLGILRVEAPSK